MSRDAEYLTHIRGGRAGVATHLREARRNTAIAYFLVIRDLKIRYRQTVFGVFWVVAQPLLLGLVLAVFLGRYAGVPTDGQPYALFAISGLAAWTYLSSAVEAGTISFVTDINLIAKVYVPRLLIPVSASLSHVVDLALGTAVAAVYALTTGHGPAARWLIVIPALAWAVILAAALATLLGTLNVRYRDVRAGVRFGLQLWLFLTPVAYSWTIVPERLRALYGLNPAAGVVSLTRWALIGGPHPPGALLIVSGLVTIGLGAAALRVFDARERHFADSI